MATTYPGGQSPTTFSKTLERVFDDAQHTGEVILSGRKLKDYPGICTKFDLVDTIVADLSKNRLTELPPEVCEYTSMERLNGYHNVMRSIPQAIVQLQALTHLNLSRNMLCNIPPFICQLQALEVMIASNNKLVSLPEEIGQLDKLMDLDVSCNEISYLPSQIGDLDSLRILNIRRNLLIELPVAISKLKLRRLDFSENKISSIPTAFRSLEMLEEMVLDHNPLTTPPAHVCKKGRVHIMKFLQIEALKEDRKRGMLSDNDMKRLVRKSLPQQPVGSDDFKHINDSQGWKRHTVVGNDSGYNTTDSNEKCNWSPMEAINDFDEINALALKAGEAVKEHRHHRELEVQRRLGTPHDMRRLHGLTTSPLGGHLAEAPPSPAHLSRLHPPPSPQSNANRHAPPESSPRMSRGPGLSPSNNINHAPLNSHSPLMQSRSPYHGHSPHPQSASPSPSSQALPPSPDTPPVISPGTPTEDAFTRELQRQRADYERRKKVAEQIRVQQQQQQLEEEEKEERRRTALKVQEEQQRVMEQKKEQMRREAEARQNDNNNGVMDVDQKSPPQMAPQARSPAKGNNPAGTPTQPKKKLENNFIPIPVVHMNHEPSEDTSPTSPSMLPTRKTTSTTNVREERRGVGSQYRRTASDSVPQTGRMGRAAANTDSQRNGVGEEKVKSEGPSPASSVSSIASNPRSTASPRHTPAVRKVPIEDRRTTQSPGTRRTKPAANTTTTSTTRTKGTTSTIASRSRTTSSSSSGGRGGIARPNHMTPRSVFNGDDAKHASPRNNITSTKNRQVLATDAIKMLEDYKDSNTGFTIRRQQEHARGDMEQLEMLRNHIEARLKVTLPDNLPDALRDGVVLCHLANQIRPRSVASIHVPSPAVPKLTLAKCRRNVENFLEACRKIGVNNEALCACEDIVDMVRPARVASTVAHLTAFPRITPTDYAVAHLCLLLFLVACVILSLRPLALN